MSRPAFKMEFKKKTAELKPTRKPPPSIAATGGLGKHDNPTRTEYGKSRHIDSSSSSSEDDILAQKSKEEKEKHKIEQTKMVEKVLLERVMKGAIDVRELVKSGEVKASAIREKIQEELSEIKSEGVSVPTTEPVMTSQPQQIQAVVNPLLRDRSLQKDTRKRRKTSSISSESSESSSSELSDSIISSESDSDEDSHKLAKKVKKLKKRNKKLKKKVKVLRKKLKESKGNAGGRNKKGDPSSSKSESSKRNSHGQPVQSLQQSGALAPMTPQQHAAQQNEVRRVYDPQTGHYRLIRGSGEVLEEIVSRDRHSQLNKMATNADGRYFQRQTHSIYGNI